MTNAFNQPTQISPRTSVIILVSAAIFLTAMGTLYVRAIGAVNRKAQLEADVLALNEAVVAFRYGGGELKQCRSVMDVLHRLSSPASKPPSTEFTFISLANELVPLMQSPGEAESDQARVLWSRKDESFRIMDHGHPGAKAFGISDISLRPMKAAAGATTPPSSWIPGKRAPGPAQVGPGLDLFVTAAEEMTSRPF